MLNVHSICDEIQDVFDNQCGYVSNINLLCDGSQRKKRYIPAVLIHPSAILVFVRFQNCHESQYKELLYGFRSVLNTLCEKISVSINSFMLCGYNDANEEKNIPAALCTYNIYNDRINYFTYHNQIDDFMFFVVNEIKSRNSMFNVEQISELEFNIQMISGSNGDVRKDSNGNYYIRKHGNWFLASEHDPDEMFQKAAYFGAFGAHKFFETKKSRGFLYFFTCGCFGVGWFFDCLMIIFGMYKDSEGKYLLPISERKNCILKMLCGLVITLIYIFIYILILRFFGDFFGSVLVTSISSKNII